MYQLDESGHCSGSDLRNSQLAKHSAYFTTLCPTYTQKNLVCENVEAAAVSASTETGR